MNKNKTTLILTLIAILALPVKSTLAGNLDSTTQKAQQHLIHLYAVNNPFARTVVKVKPLPAALNNRPCKAPISFIHAPGSSSRVSVKAICSDPAWTIFISATVEQWQKIAVSSRALSKGTILGDSDIYLRELDLKRLTSPYFSDPGELLGRELKRAIAANQVISPSLVEKKLLIRKGDLIYIEANKGLMSIRMTGTAQQNGSLGEQISVTNTRSGKTVRGYVKSRGVISVTRH